MAKRIVSRSLSVSRSKPADGVPFPPWPEPTSVPDPGTKITALVPLCSSLAKQEPQNAVALVEDFLDYGKKDRCYSESTIRQYRKVIRDFLGVLGGLNVALVKPRDIRAYLNWMLERGSSDSTLYQALCALRSFYRYLEICDVVAVSPARAVQTRKLKRRLPVPISQENIDKLIAAATNLRDQAMLEFFYSTGCRIAEVASARVENVNWSDRTVRIIGKGDKERLAPLSPRSVDLLLKYLAGRREGWLFQAEGQPNQRGSLLRTKQGKWRGYWRVDYALDSHGHLTSRSDSQLLGEISEVSREEAKEYLAMIVSKLPPRLLPVKAEPLWTESIRQIVVKAGLRAGLGHINPHRLRHSFATHLHAGGADILSVSRLMGHANVATTQIYTHVSQTTMRETLEKFHPHWRD
jgi:integrase/recombinase XerD